MSFLHAEPLNGSNSTPILAQEQNFRTKSCLMHIIKFYLRPPPMSLSCPPRGQRVKKTLTKKPRSISPIVVIIHQCNQSMVAAPPKESTSQNNLVEVI